MSQIYLFFMRAVRPLIFGNFMAFTAFKGQMRGLFAYFIGDRISNGEPENTVLILYIVIFTVLVGKLKYIYVII